LRTLLLLFISLFWFIADSSATGQWTQKADYGSFGRHRGVAVAIGTKVYAGTGHINGSGVDSWYPDWWEYDPGTNGWTQKADYIGNSGDGDQDLTAIAINNIGYVGLGQFSDAEHYKYNPTTNTWTQIADAPSGSFANTDPFVINGKGYYPEYVGGGSPLYMFDPVLDTWTIVAAMPAVVGHRDPTFVIGSKGYFKHQYSFFEFNPLTNIWTQKADFPGTAPNNNIGLSQLGSGFFVGGYLGWGDMYSEVWRYDPSNDLWEQLPDYPFTKRRWAVKAKLGERCYIGLGTNGTNFSDFWEFDQFASIEEFKVDAFKAFPTLANDHVNFVSENISDFEIVVFNTLGVRVSTITAVNGTARLERNIISSGTYIYHVVRNGEILHSERFVFR